MVCVWLVGVTFREFLFQVAKGRQSHLLLNYAWDKCVVQLGVSTIPQLGF